MIRSGAVVLCVLGVAASARPAAGEPSFLSRQYTRCTNCHYSPTGGGLLTPYGRALSREELSTFGRSPGSEPKGREHEFLFGALGDALGPVHVGIDLRPAHLDIDSASFASTRNFLMNADVTAAMQLAKWTFYAELGRQPRGDDAQVTSFEHWIGYQSDRGFGARVGRFIPAYGIKLADHTAFTRAPLALDNNDQVYGLELSHNGDRHLVQVSLGPGRAESVDKSKERAFTATGRWQYDLRSHLVLVASGLYRAASDIESRSGAVGFAVGIAPTSRLTLWTQADARFREGVTGEPGYTLLAAADYEVYRGVWVRFSPQLLTTIGDASAGALRLNFGLNLLPRTHWNVVLSYYHDRDRSTDRSSNTWLAQLHLYL